LPISDTEVAVSVVVPVRNEAENIAPLIAEIAAALDGRFAYEIIYVNDGSTDATAERLAAEMKARANLRRIDHEKSTGRAGSASVSSRASGSGARTPASRNSSRESPMACARRSSRTAPATPAAA
jgi:dolichol-phosphate mannosyltransferase